MRCGGVVVLYWAYWPRLADVVIRGGAVRSPPARSSPRAARSSQCAARIGSTFWKPRAGAAAPMGSCKLGWSGNSISFSVVSDVSYVRWLLVAALRAPRLSSRRALAVARACCPIEKGRGRSAARDICLERCRRPAGRRRRPGRTCRSYRRPPGRYEVRARRPDLPFGQQRNLRLLQATCNFCAAR